MARLGPTAPRPYGPYLHLPTLVLGYMFSTKYLPEALFFLSASYAIFKWTVRTAAEAIEPNDVESSAELELPYMLPELVARGVASAEEIARLTPHERVAMYRAVFGADERGVA